MSSTSGDRSVSPASAGWDENEGASTTASVTSCLQFDVGPASTRHDPPPPGATWTRAEEHTLRRIYPLQGAVGTRVELPHRSLDAIRAHAAKLGVHDTHRVWSPGEIECLKLVFPKGGADAVHERLPARSIEAIRHKAAELSLKHDRRSATTVPIEDIVEALERSDANVAMAARLLSCDAASLRRVATANNLVTEQDSRPHWKTTEVEVLRSEYPAGGATAVRKKLPHRSTHAIYRMAKRLGLTASS